MKIAIIVEGKTERAFMPYLRAYLKPLLPEGSFPKLDPVPYNGRIPTGEKLKRTVSQLLSDRNQADYVIALTDVYTGTIPCQFVNAQDARTKMREWVGAEPRFHPHVAQFDFEAWLLPYWETIQRLAGHNQNAPAGNPENVNHNRPPAHRIGEIFRIGQRGKSYVKPRDAGRILKDNDLSIAVNQCAELKAFVNTILSLSGGQIIV